MKVQVGDIVFSPKDVKIVLTLSPEDKALIATMGLSENQLEMKPKKQTPKQVES